MNTEIKEKDKEGMLPKIVAIDFDGTLVDNEFPEIGKIKPLFHIIKDLKSKDKIKVILWTCRTEEYLDKAIQFCKQNGLTFDAINDNIDEVKALGWNAKKVFANLYVDDRNAYYDLKFREFIPLYTVSETLFEEWLSDDGN